MMVEGGRRLGGRMSSRLLIAWEGKAEGFVRDERERVRKGREG